MPWLLPTFGKRADFCSELYVELHPSIGREEGIG